MASLASLAVNLFFPGADKVTPFRRGRGLWREGRRVPYRRRHPVHPEHHFAAGARSAPIVANQPRDRHWIRRLLLDQHGNVGRRDFKGDTTGLGNFPSVA